MKVVSILYSGGTKVVPTGTVVLEVDEQEVSEAACGNGPIDALVKAVNRCIWGNNPKSWPVRIKKMEATSLSNGSGAEAEVCIMIVFGDQEQTIAETVNHHDTVEAAILAYIAAVERYLKGETHLQS